MTEIAKRPRMRCGYWLAEWRILNYSIHHVPVDILLFLLFHIQLAKHNVNEIKYYFSSNKIDRDTVFGGHVGARRRAARTPRRDRRRPGGAEERRTT